MFHTWSGKMAHMAGLSRCCWMMSCITSGVHCSGASPGLPNACISLSHQMPRPPVPNFLDQQAPAAAEQPSTRCLIYQMVYIHEAERRCDALAEHGRRLPSVKMSQRQTQ